LRPFTDGIIGECSICLVSRFASDAGKHSEEFYTPTAVAGLLAKLAAPKPGDPIFAIPPAARARLGHSRK
jgi:type I restriction enzyme M protein